MFKNKAVSFETALFFSMLLQKKTPQLFIGHFH